MGKKIFFQNFGCRLNQYETLSLENNAVENNLETVNEISNADIVVINTCTVTNRADVKNRGAIRKARKLNPNAEIIVTGCFASTNEKELRAMKEVSRVIPNKDKNIIPTLWNNLPETIVPNYELYFPISRQVTEKMSRGYLKIQDGCDNRCSYCKIPDARGKAISRSLSSIEQEIGNLKKENFSEIILTGINIGKFNMEPERSLFDLLTHLKSDEPFPYFRISSIEPECIDDKFIDILNSKHLAKFLHLPVQSGSNTILKLMRRRYNSQEFLDKVKAIRKIIPTIHIGTDIMVGFPGETNADFEETLNLVEAAKFANIHVFPFSLRKNTSVDKWLQDKSKDIFLIDKKTIKTRQEKLNEMKTYFYRKYIAETSGVEFRGVVEKIENNSIHIVTENYIKGAITSVNTIFKKGEAVYVNYDSSGRLNLVTP